MKIRGLGTGAALAADWIGAQLAVELGVLTPRPCLVEVDRAAIDRIPRQDLRARASPGIAFSAHYIRLAQGVGGWDTVKACSDHAEFLARLLVLDTWIDTQDRMRPDFGRNLLVDAEDASPQLVAIDFGMSLTVPMIPILGGAPAAEEIRAYVPDGLPLFLDRGALREAVTHLESITDAEVITLVKTTPDSWVSEQTQGSVISYLMARRALVGPALERLLEGEPPHA